MPAALLIVPAVLALVVAWRVLRANPLLALGAVAVAGWLGHYGVLPVPAPVREASASAREWREERIAAFRCRAAVWAALASGDEDEVVRRLEAACSRGLGAQPEAADEVLERRRGL